MLARSALARCHQSPRLYTSSLISRCNYTQRLTQVDTASEGTRPDLVAPTSQETNNNIKPPRTLAVNRKQCTITTLDPTKVSFNDYCDISGVLRPVFGLPEPFPGKRWTSIHLPYAPTHKHIIPFPSSTRGFLFYHHWPDTPVTSGELRFRVANDCDQNAFERGRLLLNHFGAPWSYPALFLAKGQQPLYQLLQREGFVSAETDKRFQKIVRGQRLTLGTPMLHSIHQPFLINTYRRSTSLFIVTRKGSGPAHVFLPPLPEANLLVRFVVDPGKPGFVFLQVVNTLRSDKGFRAPTIIQQNLRPRYFDVKHKDLEWLGHLLDETSEPATIYDSPNRPF